MPIDDLTALGQKMREARKNKELTQQELSDLSHVSVKQIANIEKGKMNPSYLILRALAKVLHISLDTLINPDISLENTYGYACTGGRKSPHCIHSGTADKTHPQRSMSFFPSSSSGSHG